jgi:hypothetical protein
LPEQQKNPSIQQITGILDGRRESEVSVLMRVRLTVRTAGTARLGASAQRLVNDGLDGARAPAALGTATEASIELLGIPGKVFCATDRSADVVVGEDVTGTNNHKMGGPSVLLTHRY